MATQTQLASIEKARKRKEQIDEWQVKAEKFDKIHEAFHDIGFSVNRRQRNLISLRNSWPELFSVLKELSGLNEDDSSLL